ASLVVSVSHVRADPAVAVGAAVTAGASRLGSIVDYSHAERQALARHTNHAGHHVVGGGPPPASPSGGSKPPGAHPLRRRRVRRPRPSRGRGAAARPAP